MPEPSKPHSAEQDPIQRLIAYAFVQEQKSRKDAEDELRKDSARLSAVIATQHRIATSPLTLEQSLGLIIEQARSLTGAGGAAIALRSGREVICRASSGLIAPQVGARLNPEAGISGACLRSGQIQLVDDTETDPRVDMWVCRSLGMRSILAVAVQSQQEVVGILEIFSGWANAFRESDVRTTKLLAGLVIEALWSQEAQQRQAPPGPQPVAAPVADPSPAVSVVVPPSPEEVSNPLDDAQITAALADLAASIAQSDLVIPTQEETPEPTQADVPVAVPAALELEAPAFSALTAGKPRTHARTLKIAAVAVVVGLALLEAAVDLRGLLNLGNRSTSIRSTAERPPEGAESQPESAQPAEPVAQAPNGPAQVTSVRYWSKPDATTLAIFMESPARWDSGVLSNPNRIYFDLSNARMAGELAESAKDGRTIPVNDGLVQRIRVVPKDGGAVRVVVDLAAPAEHASVFSPTEPYRLMIAIRNPTLAKKNASPELDAKAAPATRTPAAQRTVKVVIDAGHGGSEEGAIGRGGLKEKDLTLAIAKRLGELLTNRLGVQVIYTRTEDRNVPLEMRAVMANEANADLFVSIHANSSGDPNSRGVETYYVDGRPSPVGLAIAARENAGAHKGAAVRESAQSSKLTESRKLASDVQQAVYQTAAGERGVLNRGVKQAPFLVLLDAEMPSILAEVAFVTNTTDEQRLGTPEGQEAVAEGLYKGISRYLTESKRGKVVAGLPTQHGQ